MKAAEHGHAEVVAVLLWAGGDVRCRDARGRRVEEIAKVCFPQKRIDLMLRNYA